MSPGAQVRTGAKVTSAARHGTELLTGHTSISFQQNLNILSVSSVAQNQTSKADRTPKKTSDLATDGHGYTRIAGFLAFHWEKIGSKLYGYVLAKRYTSYY